MATIVEPVAVPLGDERVRYIQWGPAVAGALAAAAVALVLHSFAAALGIALSSTAPTWRDASMALLLLSGLYLVFAAIVSLGIGGYIAGRVRGSLAVGGDDEIEFRDGTHGLLVWAIALLITALLAWVTTQTATRVAAPPSGSAQSVAGENIIAYDLDRLFRAEKRPLNIDIAYPRSEAARILLTAAGHSGVTSDDRTYLVRLTAAYTGLAPAEAEKRVTTVIAQARENIRRARQAAVILAFMAGAAALLGAAVAWFAACAGGQHRDGVSALSMGTWTWNGPRRAL